MSTWSSGRSAAPAPSAADTGLARRTASRPYVEGMIEALRRAGDQPLLRCAGADTTGSELLAAIYRYACALESLGVARGDLLAMYAPNRPEALALRYATHLLGAASVYLSAPPDPGKRAQMLVDFLLPPSPRSRASGSLICSWSSRSCSTSWIILTLPAATSVR